VLPARSSWPGIEQHIEVLDDRVGVVRSYEYARVGRTTLASAKSLTPSISLAERASSRNVRVRRWWS
jgi:hypothetical protein